MAHLILSLKVELSGHLISFFITENSVVFFFSHVVRIARRQAMKKMNQWNTRAIMQHSKGNFHRSLSIVFQWVDLCLVLWINIHKREFILLNKLQAFFSFRSGSVQNS